VEEERAVVGEGASKQGGEETKRNEIKEDFPTKKRTIFLFVC